MPRFEILRNARQVEGESPSDRREAGRRDILKSSQQSSAPTDRGHLAKGKSALMSENNGNWQATVVSMVSERNGGRQAD